ncbi:MAG: SDR family oxidoreductase [Rhodospirillaceae bacterium]|nr:SDR family oxidoreductase [Rhodospirillaceae bacterium]
MPTVLITGAGRGIGLEFARQYGEAGWSVLAGARTPDGIGHLMALEGDISAVQLDIADPASVAIMAERLRGVPIDLMINNAGIYGPRTLRPGAMDFAVWREVLEVNLIGSMRAADAFTEHVLDSEMKKIAFVTSKMGSIADNTSGGAYAYRASKAALNAAVRSLAIDLEDRGVTVTLLHPGWVRTDMGGHGAPIGVEESVSGMRQVISRVGTSHSGQFWNYDGSALSW